jgi:hypothetical protein
MKKITFIPSSKETELLLEPPSSAKKLLPDWYKKTPTFDPLDYKSKTLKQCMPFLDAMTGGYIQKTWADIFIGVKDDKVFFESAQGPEIISWRETPNVAVDDLYYPIEFIWKMHWAVKLPKGYSLLLTHPHNRLDLPFTTMSGVIDSDLFYHTPMGNVPFYIRKGFNGFIPMGTPMYQLAPIKRENWSSQVRNFDETERQKSYILMTQKFYGVYRNMFWQKKTYN